MYCRRVSIQQYIFFDNYTHQFAQNGIGCAVLASLGIVPTSLGGPLLNTSLLLPLDGSKIDEKAMETRRPTMAGGITGQNTEHNRINFNNEHGNGLFPTFKLVRQ